MVECVCGRRCQSYRIYSRRGVAPAEITSAGGGGSKLAAMATAAAPAAGSSSDSDSGEDVLLFTLSPNKERSTPRAACDPQLFKTRAFDDGLPTNAVNAAAASPAKQAVAPPSPQKKKSYDVGAIKAAILFIFHDQLQNFYPVPPKKEEHEKLSLPATASVSSPRSTPPRKRRIAAPKVAMATMMEEDDATELPTGKDASLVDEKTGGVLKADAHAGAHGVVAMKEEKPVAKNGAAVAIGESTEWKDGVFAAAVNQVWGSLGEPAGPQSSSSSSEEEEEEEGV